MSSWVTSRQSLGPIGLPISSFSSSMPFTVVGVLMAGSLSVVVPGLRRQRFAERLRAAAHDRVSVGHEHVLGAQVQEWLERRVEALPVEALHLRVDPVSRPDDEAALPLGDGIAEDKRVVAREVER